MKTTEAWLAAHRETMLGGLNQFLLLPSVRTDAVHLPDMKRTATFRADLSSILADRDLALYSAPVASEVYIAVRADKPPFDKREVRQTLAEAIDLDALVKAVFQGTGRPTAAMISSSLWGHNDRVKPRDYDPAHAKQLLAEAGYHDGFKTHLWAFSVVRAYMPDGRRAAEMIQADLAKIGVQAEIETYEWGGYLRRIRAGGAPGGTWDYLDPTTPLRLLGLSRRQAPARQLEPLLQPENQ